MKRLIGTIKNIFCRKPLLAAPAVMPRFNLNHQVIIYPNENGWRKIKALIASKYLISDEDAEKWVNSRKTKCGGYQDQLWVIIADLNDMFYGGQNYIASTWVSLINEA